MPESNSDHRHEDNPRAGRVCMIHSDHWDDDMAYASDIANNRPQDENWEPPTFDEMITVLKNAEVAKANPEIFRFALVFSDGQGKMNILASPGSEPNEAVNLLAKAISLTAFQQVEEDRMLQEQLREKVLAKLKDAIGYDPDDPDSKPIDVPGGMYL